MDFYQKQQYIDGLLDHLKTRYYIQSYQHSIAILKQDFTEEFIEILEILNDFQLLASDIITPGGSKSPISSKIDSEFYKKNWLEKEFYTSKSIDGSVYNTPTHKIDCYKNRIAFEIEWNNKDPFYDRDLNNFRLLYDLKAISVGIILTRCTSLQKLFAQLGKGKSYGNSTTHIDKLTPRIEGNGAGGCPLLIIGIHENNYVDDRLLQDIK